MSVAGQFGIAVCLIAWLVAAPATWAFSCNGRIVDMGERADEVARKCGQPDHREEWEEQLIQEVGERFAREVSVTWTEWIYDRGPDRFLQVLLFRNSRLQQLQTRGYGVRTAASGCSERIVDIDDTKLEVLRKCGEPNTREKQVESRTEPLDEVHRRRFPIVTEVWTYLPGSGSLKRIVVFRNRRVTAIEVGGGS